MNGFQLDELRIDPLTGEVAGPGGREKLDPKVMQVLVYMAERPGQVVTREELLSHLWPGAVVTDDALTRCFYELRRQLSHAGGDERYRLLLETLPKRGYRLNGKVSQPSPKKRTLVPGIAAAAFATAIAALLLLRSPDTPVASPQAAATHSIAVLPFLDMSAEEDQAFFSDGVTEEILNQLTQADNLRVISRTSSFSLRDESLDVPQIGERLDVAYILEGSVRKAGDRVRITAQLIDVSTNSHLWSKTYDRGIDDLFAIQDEIASSVAAALQVTLAGGPKARKPQNVDAYERYLQGHYFYSRRAPGDIDRSVKYYQEAVAIDPGYARAYAALAGAYSLLAMDDDRPDKPLRDLQGEAARKAVELDPKLAVAHARLAQYYFNTEQPELGDEHMRTATSLDPNDPLVLGFTGSEAVRQGNLDEAVSLWRRIVAQDPLSPTERGNLAIMLLANGQYEEALAESRKVLELHPDSAAKDEIEVARTLILMGRFDEAQSAIAQLPAGSDRDYALALLHEAPAHRSEADAALKRLQANAGDARSRIYLADAYAYRGMRDEAFAPLLEIENELECDKNKRPYLRWRFHEELRLSPFLKPLHDDPRWAILLEEPG